MAPACTSDLANTFRTQGYLLIEGLLDQRRVAAFTAALQRQVDGLIDELVREGLITAPDPALSFARRFIAARAHATRFGRSWRKSVVSPELFELHRDPALLDLLVEILGHHEILGHPVWNARPKLPDQELTTVPWHQDSSYFGPDTAGSRIITAWLPLVPADEACGCLQVVPGSDREGLLPHRQERAGGGFLEIADRQPDPAQVRSIPCRPGDVLILNNLLWHRSLPNRSEIIRWSLDCRFYAGGDEPGAIARAEMPDDWVLRSATRPTTGFAEWQRRTTTLPW